ncbi:cob(I)yrinic acid a,c-diamide adenosyltransferase [Candidatus Woesearchaeota archaeon]|jgi:cob(I)alamin adenosyltransferase|nr:cob(I)yrinic acid a,c-diamide adenosyltransferase [Candidatus Woesearchaeota archaeon]
MTRTGQVHIYTGDGKGKTTASLGLALRAIGQGFKVCMVQFMKGGAYTGEFISSINYLPNIEMIQFGRPCIKQKKQIKISNYNRFSPDYHYVRDAISCGSCRYCFLNDDIQCDYVEEAFQKALEIVMAGNHQLVILDEINVAASLDFINLELVLNLIANKPNHVELVLTGRNAPLEFIHVADLVTEMKLHKHYFDKGLEARKGIEY